MVIMERFWMLAGVILAFGIAQVRSSGVSSAQAGRAEHKVRHRDGEGEHAPMSSSEQKLREEIEHLRGHLGGTVEALVHKADLPARAKERGSELKARVAERGSELRDRAVEAAARAREAARQAPKDRWAKRAGSGLMLTRDRAKGAQLVSVRSKATYELVSLASGVLGGALAGALFNRIWRAVSDEAEAPTPTAMDHSIRQVLVAGALHGAIFGLVKAALGRVTAKGYRQFTGNAPNR